MDNSDGPSVEGPAFAEKVREAEEATDLLQRHNWDFKASPKVYALQATCDVAAKEIILIHDGEIQTRIGRLVMLGAGTVFNLMGPESARSIFKDTGSHAFDEVNRQLGSRGLHDVPAFERFARAQEVTFYNHTAFYQLRDLVFWSILHGGGLFPSGFAKFAQEIASGKIIHNALFTPAIRSKDTARPVSMAATCLSVSFPTSVVEWMEKPIYGGMVTETIHIVNLLTPRPTTVSHPYLPLTGEGKVSLNHHPYYLRRFVGVSPKDGLRGPGVAPEGPQTKLE